jgi:hypothetical protein
VGLSGAAEDVVDGGELAVVDDDVAEGWSDPPHAATLTSRTGSSDISRRT